MPARNGHHVRPTLVDGDVHRGFKGWPPGARDLVAVHVELDQLFLADSGQRDTGRDEDAPARQPGADVAKALNNAKMGEYAAGAQNFGAKFRRRCE